MPPLNPSASPTIASQSWDGLTASDWLTAILSVIAIGVSILAIVVTLLWRSRPLIRVEYSELQHNDDSEVNPTSRLRIANRGNGEAWDVRVRVHPGDGLNEVESVGTLKPDQSYDQEYMVTKFIPFEPTAPHGAGAWDSGPVDPKKLRITIRWRALPFIRWYRRMIVKPGTRGENLTWYEPAPDSDLGKSSIS